MAICPNCGEQNPETAKFCSECGAALQTRAAPPREARKTVTVVFSDVVGSTSLGEHLDPESLREVLDRYFSDMRSVIEYHGGVIEKYIGDAIMAVFGLPRAREDDALRAVRAAAEMREALATLNLELEQQWGVRLANRTGVNTGEVVIGDPASGQRLVTGDTVNVAARFEQAAPEGQVLIGHSTHGLVKDAVVAEVVEPLALKGKSEALAAFRLVDVIPQAPGVARRLDVPVVGREAELAALGDAFDAAVADRKPRLATVVGEPGVGKSRLVVEAVARLGEQATVLEGRCLSYGEGITFWPLAEVIRQAAGIDQVDSLDKARLKLSSLLAGIPARDSLFERLASLVGLSEAPFAVEDSLGASRQLFEHLAARRSLVVVFEDLHWAQPTFLELLENLVALATAAPILFVCSARPELLEQRPGWEATERFITMPLEPLDPGAADLLMYNLLGSEEVAPQARERIAAAAQGNPLFVEQILSMWLEDGILQRDAGGWTLTADVSSAAIPPTISALLAARLDRLAREERAVLAPASVIGQVFYRGAVAELSAEGLRPVIDPSLSALARKQLVAPVPSDFAGEAAFSFRHVLIRDAAYEAMLKKTRSVLHERFAAWLETVAGERVSEYEEVIAYHLEQAYWWRTSVRVADESVVALGTSAADRLVSAGRKASARDDMFGAANLLSRAAALFAECKAPRPDVLADLGAALCSVGELQQGEEVLDRAIAQAQEASDERTELQARLERAWRVMGISSDAGYVRDEAERGIRVAERLRDERGLMKAWWLQGGILHDIEGRCSEAAAAWERALVHARRAGDKATADLLVGLHFQAVTAGPVPVLECLEEFERVLEVARGRRSLEGDACLFGGLLQGMLGHFDEARRLVTHGRDCWEEAGFRYGGVASSQLRGRIEYLAGNLEEAERCVREGYEALERMGDTGQRVSNAAILGHICYDLGRLERAERWSAISESLAASEDFAAQVEWRTGRAKVLARKGLVGQAERLAREAVAMVHTSDWLDFEAQALMALAEVLQLDGSAVEAASNLKAALSLYERKGNLVMVGRAHRKLEEFDAPD